MPSTLAFRQTPPVELSHLARSGLIGYAMGGALPRRARGSATFREMGRRREHEARRSRAAADGRRPNARRERKIEALRQ
jgi:hypothetical protein